MLLVVPIKLVNNKLIQNEIHRKGSSLGIVSNKMQVSATRINVLPQKDSRSGNVTILRYDLIQ